MSNIKKIQEIPIIKSVESICFKDLSEKFDNEIGKARAIENDGLLFAYKIKYISQKHLVTGYIVEPKKGKNLPCIVYNRGGTKDLGKLEDTDVFLSRLSRFAREGYVLIASQYSGNSESEGEDEFGGEDLHDVLNLHKILTAYDRADTERIGMFGESRGGMMTYLALSKTKWIKAAVVDSALSDLFDKDEHRPDFQKHLKNMFGGSIDEKKKRSALYWPEKFPKNAPILIMHGTSDWRVNPMDSLRLAEKFQKLKVPYRLIMYEGACHGIIEFRKEASEEMVRWFNRYVRDKEPLPNLESHGK
jgi:dipeptidyl aminopeptidase/acylaminoacyl peptidase